jgi:hypothetical protein
VTFTVIEPPADVTDEERAVAETRHFVGEGPAEVKVLVVQPTDRRRAAATPRSVPTLARLCMHRLVRPVLEVAQAAPGVTRGAQGSAPRPGVTGGRAT